MENVGSVTTKTCKESILKKKSELCFMFEKSAHKLADFLKINVCKEIFYSCDYMSIQVLALGC